MEWWAARREEEEEEGEVNKTKIERAKYEEHDGQRTVGIVRALRPTHYSNRPPGTDSPSHTLFGTFPFDKHLFFIYFLYLQSKLGSRTFDTALANCIISLIAYFCLVPVHKLSQFAYFLLSPGPHTLKLHYQKGKVFYCK